MEGLRIFRLGLAALQTFQTDLVERIDAIWDTLGLPGDKRSIWK